MWWQGMTAECTLRSGQVDLDRACLTIILQGVLSGREEPVQAQCLDYQGEYGA